MSKSDDKKYETTGKVIFGAAYFVFAVKCTVIFSLIALAVLWLCHKPLWYAPLLGIAVFLVYRLFRRLIFSLVIRFARWADNDNDPDSDPPGDKV